MEYNKVNFALIEECLGACKSKEAMLQIFMACAGSLKDSEIRVLKSDNLPGVLKSMPAELEISNEKAMGFIVSLHSLMKEYIANDEETILERFPEKFNKKMKSALFKMMREVAEPAKKYIQDEFTSLPRLRDFDWRLDVKISSKKSDRLKQPMLYVKMDFENDANPMSEDVTENKKEESVLFQVSKNQLKELLNNFETINAQLTGLTTQM